MLNLKFLLIQSALTIIFAYGAIIIVPHQYNVQNKEPSLSKEAPLASTSSSSAPETVKQNFKLNDDGSFEWNFALSDGSIKQEQAGVLKANENFKKNTNESEKILVFQGESEWEDSDGKKHSIIYVADENGYQPQSSDIPVPPEIPPAISRALQYIAEHPSKESED